MSSVRLARTRPGCCHCGSWRGVCVCEYVCVCGGGGGGVLHGHTWAECSVILIESLPLDYV